MIQIKGIDLAAYTSSQVKLAYEIQRGLTEHNADVLGAPLHKDFRYVPHPRSLSKPSVDRDEWVANMVEASHNFESITHHSVVETPEKVVLHISFNVKGWLGKDGTDESIWIVNCTGEGESMRVNALEQFITKDYVELLRAEKASK